VLRLPSADTAQYLDATLKGGRARFINHSCSPNCYVAKWHVGKHMRMGIFAQRDIAAGEELTFNYNVDRYGHDAQECFCGEANCVGTLGGKTQTDIGGMDQLFIDGEQGVAGVAALLLTCFLQRLASPSRSTTSKPRARARRRAGTWTRTSQ
jgi:hypothetical protein